MQSTSFKLIVTGRRFNMCNLFTFIDVRIGMTLWSTFCSVLQVLGIRPVETDHQQQTNRNETSTLANRFLIKKTTSSRNERQFTALHDPWGVASTVERLMDIIIMAAMAEPKESWSNFPPFFASDVFSWFYMTEEETACHFTVNFQNGERFEAISFKASFKTSLLVSIYATLSYLHRQPCKIIHNFFF